MTRDELVDVVLEELGNIAPEVELEALNRDADLREEVDIDSMDFLNLVIALHQRLKVEIPEADYAALTSVNAFAGYLSAKGA